ncbi:hypothetical protein SBOR_9542 [Sclerotinia borealis F-4128]|uniref:Uncharacterized protein n=1 Tax=Sclerotinia borealis (strain F-4128) TaxID=1432307 RepID=W9C2Z1_SCLBF|nr:hypothetical protein SBOR_9542 [Sclerotinia borealis F-4128]
MTERPLTKAEIKKIEDDFNKPIIMDVTPREPTVKDAKFFFIILNSMRIVPDIDWALVAHRAGYANATSARTRFGQIRRKLRDHYGTETYQDKVIPKVVDGISKRGKGKGAATNPKPPKFVTRKTTKVAAPWNVDKNKPSKFAQNYGQGYVISRNDDNEANFITSANERDDFDSENEYQNEEIFDLQTYPGYDKDKNTLAVSDQGDTDDDTREEDGDDEHFYDADDAKVTEA